MTDKIVDFPSPTSPDPGDGSVGQNSTFEQHQHKPTTKTLVRDNVHARIQDFFVRRGGGPGSSTYFTVYREGPMVILHNFQGGPTFSRGGGPIANFYGNPYNYNL